MPAVVLGYSRFFAPCRGKKLLTTVWDCNQKEGEPTSISQTHRTILALGVLFSKTEKKIGDITGKPIKLVTYESFSQVVKTSTLNTGGTSRLQ